MFWFSIKCLQGKDGWRQISRSLWLSRFHALWLSILKSQFLGFVYITVGVGHLYSWRPLGTFQHSGAQSSPELSLHWILINLTTYKRLLKQFSLSHQEYKQPIFPKYSKLYLSKPPVLPMRLHQTDHHLEEGWYIMCILYFLSLLWKHIERILWLTCNPNCSEQISC